MVKISHSDERHTHKEGEDLGFKQNILLLGRLGWRYEEGAVGIRDRGSGSSPAQPRDPPENANRKHETQTSLNILKLF